MPFFETGDHTRLSYRDWGTGAPVVFVSSWAFGGAMWEYQTVPLSDHSLRCITYDRRGHGRSDDPGRGYEFATLADDLAALLAQLDLRAVTLVGHSTGCGEIARIVSTKIFWRSFSANRLAHQKHQVQHLTALLLGER